MANLPEKYTVYNEDATDQGFTAITRGHLWTEDRVETATSVSVAFHAATRSGDAACKAGRLSGWAGKVNVRENGKWGQYINITYDYCKWQGTGSRWKRTYQKLEHPQQIPVQMGYSFKPKSATVWHYTDVVYLDVPALARKNPSLPSISIAPTVVTAAQMATISWSANPNGTNLHFKEWRLYAINPEGERVRIYSGAATSQRIKPSDFAPVDGGKVTFEIEAIYLWDGKENVYKKAATVDVLGGGCTIYDDGGNARKAIISIYDSQGEKHSVLPTYFDAQGNPHSVI